MSHFHTLTDCRRCQGQAQHRLRRHHQLFNAHHNQVTESNPTGNAIENPGRNKIPCRRHLHAIANPMESPHAESPPASAPTTIDSNIGVSFYPRNPCNPFNLRFRQSPPLSPITSHATSPCPVFSYFPVLPECLELFLTIEEPAQTCYNSP